MFDNGKLPMNRSVSRYIYQKSPPNGTETYEAKINIIKYTQTDSLFHRSYRSEMILDADLSYELQNDPREIELS